MEKNVNNQEVTLELINAFVAKFDEYVQERTGTFVCIDEDDVKKTLQQLSTEEFYILHSKLMSKKTFKTIGDILGKSTGQVAYAYYDILDKCYSYLVIDYKEYIIPEVFKILVGSLKKKHIKSAMKQKEATKKQQQEPKSKESKSAAKDAESKVCNKKSPTDLTGKVLTPISQKMIAFIRSNFKSSVDKEDVMNINNTEIIDALQRLDVIKYYILQERVEEGRTFQSIADELEVSFETIRLRYKKALRLCNGYLYWSCRRKQGDTDNIAFLDISVRAWNVIQRNIQVDKISELEEYAKQYGLENLKGAGAETIAEIKKALEEYRLVKVAE